VPVKGLLGSYLRGGELVMIVYLYYNMAFLSMTLYFIVDSFILLKNMFIKKKYVLKQHYIVSAYQVETILQIMI